MDRETGEPGRIPENVRLAYMSVDVKDLPTDKVDLAFRDYKARDVVQKRVNGVFVCPVENGSGIDLTCEKCKVCFRNESVPGKRFELKLG